MKRLLVVINNFELGGIQRAGVDFLRVISKEYEVSVRCFSHTGELLTAIPSGVALLPAMDRLAILSRTMEQLKAQSKKKYFCKAFWTLVARLIGGVAAHRIYFAGIHEPESYDIAISYTQDVNGKSFSVGCNDYVTMCVSAKKKFTFVHCDFARYGGNDAINRKRYQHFDRILCVSEGCRTVFNACCPEYQDKTSVVRNCIDLPKIQKLSEAEPYLYDKGYVNLLTVTRLSVEKGLLRMLDVMASLKAQKSSMFSLRWYVVGDGPLLEEVRQAIAEKQLSDCVFLMGSTDNPYRYMCNADCFVLPSFHECAPVVFTEACALGLPIFATETISAKEMVEDAKCGWVCENSEEGMINGLATIMEDLSVLEQLKLRIKYNGSKTVESFKDVVGG